MSTRVISDRELLHNLRFEVEELREHVAALHLRLERFAVIVGDDAREHSVRVDDWSCSHGYFHGLECPDCDVPAHLPAVLS